MSRLSHLSKVLEVENQNDILDFGDNVYKHNGVDYLVLTKSEAKKRAVKNFLKSDLGLAYLKGKFSIKGLHHTAIDIDEEALRKVALNCEELQDYNSLNKLIKMLVHPSSLESMAENLLMDSYGDLIKDYLFENQEEASQWQLLNSLFSSSSYLVYEAY